MNAKSLFGSPDGVVRLTAVAGSLMLPVGGVPEAVNADAALLADVPQELGQIRLGTPSLTIPLGRGETTATLLRKAEALDPTLRPLRQAISALGTVDLNDGLGMLASLGAVAAMIALTEQKLPERIERELIVPLLRLKNGTIRHASLLYFNSLAGGTGPLAGKAFAESVAARLHALTEATVATLAFQVGALTFLGLGERIFSNAAAGLAEQLAAVFDPTRHPLESRQLLLTELPTVDTAGHEVGSDRALRSTLGVSAASAFACTAIQEKILADRPNRTLASRCGVITVLRPSWYGTLGRDVVIAEAARYYANELSRSSSGGVTCWPAPNVEVQLSPLPPDPKSVDQLVEIVRRAHSVKPIAFDDDACASPKYIATVSIGELTLEREIAEATESVVTSGPATAAARLEALVRALTAASLNARSELSRLAPSVAWARRRLLSVIAALFPRSHFQHARTFLTGLPRLTSRFRWVLSAWREAQEREARIRFRAQALEEAEARVQAALESVRALVERLHGVLLDLAAPARPAMFFFAPLAEISPEMVRCVMRGDLSLLRSLLARSARHTTIEGLARLVGAKQVSPSEIATRLLGTPQFQAPHWGGADPGSVPFLRAIVLPPMADALARQVREAGEQAGMSQELVIGDTLAGGAAVVGLEAYEVTSEASLFTPPYLCGLRLVLGRERELYPLSPRAREIAISLVGEEAVCES
jgi:hypothetical protein